VLREQGNQAFKENNLEMAKFFYCTAMGAIQENLRHQAMSDAFDQILDEACKCTCNLSLVYLKEKNYKEALHSAEKCCQMQPNYAKVCTTLHHLFVCDIVFSGGDVVTSSHILMATGLVVLLFYLVYLDAYIFISLFRYKLHSCMYLRVVL